MKKSFAIIGLILLGALIFMGSVQFARDQRPPLPVTWFQVYPGMTPEQVRSLIGDDIYDLRATQGFDVVVHKDKYGHWQMILRYDSTGHVVSGTASYVHTFGFGLLNTRGKRVL
jgi:hypothetical protein